MDIDVVWLEPGEQWDQHTFELLFNNKLWLTPFSFKHHKDFVEAEGIVLVVPQKYYVDKVDWLNKQVKQYKWLLYIGTGNEEGEFPIDRIEHPNKIIYYTTPHLKNTPMDIVDRFFGDGYPLQSESLKEFTEEVLSKPFDVYFGGQITHERRQQFFEASKVLTCKNEIYGTPGFTQGYDDPKEYYKRMASAKITPCPSGPYTPDTFRSYEALEAMSLPILDTRTPSDSESTDYWRILFGEEPPVPMISNWESLDSYCSEILEKWPSNINKAVAWWMGKKRQYALDFIEDIEKLTGEKSAGEQITVLVPTSPIPSHPDTAILDETISTIRTHLPDSEIILMVDGVREEQSDRKTDYENYIYRVLWKCLHEWKNVLPLIFDEHQHQANMTLKTLDYVKTPLILFVEHDTPITPDREIPFEGIYQAVLTGQADMVRLHYEALIHPEHKHLMFDTEAQIISGVPMMRTQQWSQRPHVASVAFYKRVLTDYFHGNKTMIEDKMYGVVEEACKDGVMGWYNFRLWIYTPEGDIKRSYHTDGREGDPKWTETYGI